MGKVYHRPLRYRGDPRVSTTRPTSDEFFTIRAWHRKAFRIFWTWKIRRGKPGRPAVPPEVRDLIRRMSRENPGWGASRIHGEVLKLGINIGETSVSKYLVRSRKPPSQTWRTFLDNHIQSLVSVDFFTVPTIGLQILYVFLVWAHDRRRILHFAVTAHPTAEWTAQQMREAFPWDSAPHHLLRDRDRIFGHDFVEQVRAVGIKQVLSAPRSLLAAFIRGTSHRHDSPRVPGSHDRSTSAACTDTFKASSTTIIGAIRIWHLEKDARSPDPSSPPASRRIIAIPEVGGLHHRYERRAA